MSEDCQSDQDATWLDPTATNPTAYTTFVDDKWLAQRTGFKPPTFRGQRFKRLHDEDHWFDVDPVYIGSKPRYRLSDALAWLKRLGYATKPLSGSPEEEAVADDR